MKKLFSFSFKLLLSFLLTLVLIEIGLRLFPVVIPLQLLIHFNEFPRADIARSRNLSNKWDAIYLERDDGGPPLWIYRPFTKIRWGGDDDQGVVPVRTMDDLGFCNPPENSYHLPVIDVLALGDSFTTCYAVNPQDTWSSKLSRLTNLSVYNLGHVGIGLHKELQILKAFGLAKSPRIVILNVYEGNDLRDALRYHSYRQESQQPQAATTERLTEELSLNGLLGRYSYAFNLFFAFGKYWQDTNLVTSLADLPLAESTANTPLEDIDFRYDLVFGRTVISFNPSNEDKDEVRNALRVQNRTPNGEEEITQIIEEPLAAFVELSRQYGFTPVVTYTPSAYSVYAANVVFKDPLLAEIMPAFSQYQRKFLRETGQELGYYFVDFTPALQQAAQAEGPANLLYFPVNRHLTPAGHDAIAKALSVAFRDIGITAQ